MKLAISLACAAVVAASCASAADNATGLSCATLTTLRIPDVRVVRTTEVVPDPVWLAPLPTETDRFRAPVRAAFCRVEGMIEDEIGFERAVLVVRCVPNDGGATAVDRRQCPTADGRRRRHDAVNKVLPDVFDFFAKHRRQR